MPVKPESQGMCSTRLARIDRFLAERYVDSGKLPCALLQVARGGQLVHQSVLGKASLETGAPLAEDSIVRIYSMSKPITSVAFMMLVEEGLVALDDPVHRFIPSWRNLGVYVGGGGGLPGTPPGWLTRPTDAPMRMIDLLRHTSGLTYGFQNRTNVDAAYRANKHRHLRAQRRAAGLRRRAGRRCRWSSRRARPGTTRSPPTCWATWCRPDLRPALRAVPAQPHLRAAGHA